MTAISDLGGAAPGDRTMIDALRPAADAVAAAERGVEATRGMAPRAGRASYLGERAVGVPDAGATAVVEGMKAI